MLDDVVALTKKFITFKSHADNPQELSKILACALSYCSGYTIETFGEKGVKSALVYNTPKRPTKFKILLNAHLDVVPGKSYVPIVKEEKLYGVGALDMKANAACMLYVFKEIAKKVNYPLALQLVTDEEVGGFHGTKYQIEKGVRADFVIAGETTNFRIANKSKGIIWLKITAKGATAHGAYPWKGDNAISRMSNFIQLLEEKFPNPNEEIWATTINISNIASTNETFNKIPDDCTISLDIRYIPEDENKIIQTINKLLPRNLTMEILLKEPALLTKESNDYIKLLKKIAQDILGKQVSYHSANGSSDARHFAMVHCDGIEFGPLGGGIGSDNEWIDIPSLEKYYEILKTFLLSLS